MSSSKKRLSMAFALLGVLVPATTWGQPAEQEMRRGQLEGPAKSNFSRIAFSPDGKLVAAGSIQGSTISVFDVGSAKEKVRLQLPNDNYDYHLVFSSDCRTLVSVGREDEMIRVWDVVTGKQLKEFKKPLNSFLAFASGGKQAVYKDRGTLISAYEVETGKLLWTTDCFALKNRLMGVRACSFSPDGKALAVHGVNGEVQLWDAQSGAFIRVMDDGDQRAGGAFKFVTFSPDGKHIATGGHSDDSLHIWEVATGKERLRIKHKREQGWFFGASFSPDGGLMAYTSSDGFILYDLANAKELVPLRGNGGFFSPDGSLLAVPGQTKDRDAIITLYDMPKRRQEALPRQLTADQLEALWQDLPTGNDFQLQRILASFRAAPADSATFLGKKLNPVGQAESKRIAELLNDLDADNPKTREKAMESLQELAAVFEPLLAKVAQDHESGEVRNRVRLVLRKQREKAVPQTLLVQLRAVTLLEQIGNTQARQALEKIAAGGAGARLTEEAKQSLERLRQ
jgi:WD40 repeat protein